MPIMKFCMRFLYWLCAKNNEEQQEPPLLYLLDTISSVIRSEFEDVAEIAVIQVKK